MTKFLPQNWLKQVTKEEKEQEVLICKWKYPFNPFPGVMAYRILMYQASKDGRADAAAARQGVTSSINFEEAKSLFSSENLPLYKQLPLLLDPEIPILQPLNPFQRYLICLVAELGLTEAAKELGEPVSSMHRYLKKIREKIKSAKK